MSRRLGRPEEQWKRSPEAATPAPSEPGAGRQRRRAEQAAAEAERLRIARELHDIVAHSLSVVAIQADAANALLPGRPQSAQMAVTAIRQTAQQALEETRRLLGTLRSESDLSPAESDGGLRDVDALIAQARDSGQRVDLCLDGSRIDLPTALDRSAFRILQEGLTNVGRHAWGSDCEVTIRYRPDMVELSVVNTASTSAITHAEPSGGYGLIGIRERVQALGGRMSAGPDPKGGWALRTELPLTLSRR